MTNTTDGGAAGMTAAQMLDLHDRFMGGEPITDGEKAAADHVARAAAFGVEAFIRHPGCDGGAINALLRSFLTALVDPMHPDLDYLRQDAEAAKAAREAGQ